MGLATGGKLPVALNHDWSVHANRHQVLNLYRDWIGMNLNVQSYEIR
jgi:hypothetical protein